MRTSLVTLGAVALLAVGGAAQAAPPALVLTPAVTGLSGPVDVASTDADPTALYIVEQGGTIRRAVGGVIDPQPFLDISNKVSQGGEQGLLSMVFSPTFGDDDLFYVFYTAKNGAIRIVQYQLRPGKSPKAKSLLSVSHPKAPNHNGGQLAFDLDGMLYAGIGDGGGSGDQFKNAQNPKKKLGKLLRAAGPKFNKWTTIGFGLRNPWRMSFDSATGDLYIGDVGQGEREEINYRTAAELATPANYGWSRYEGTEDYDTEVVLEPALPHEAPIHEYDHAISNCPYAIIGGYVYHGTDMPSEVGRYFFSDLCTGKIWTIAAGGGDLVEEIPTVDTPGSFGVDAAGELYVTSLADGTVYSFDES